MSLLEFMRKTNKDGKVHHRLHQQYKALQKQEHEDVADQTLEQWVNGVKSRGEVMVAAICNARSSDSFYGQWLVLHQPFRTVNDLWDDQCNLVPEGYRYFTLCLLRCPDVWEDLNRVRSDMELEAYRDSAIETNLAMLRAHSDMIQDYKNGNLVVGRDPTPPRHAHMQFAAELEPEQALVATALSRRWRRACELAWPDEIADQEPQGPAAEDCQPYAVLGPAGSGKSFTVQAVIREALAEDARVILVCPTRILVAAYREKMPDLDVDSIHSAFRIFHLEHETLDAMTHFDLIVVEEVGQLSQGLFERLLRLWEAAACRPALVFVGDFAQLRGIELSRATHSPRWREVNLFELKTMRRCKCETLKWKLELLRTAKPSKAQLGDILRGHKAPRPEHRSSYYMSDTPSEEDIKWIFTENPDTMFIAITRSSVAYLNQMALKHFFEGCVAIDEVPGDPESNPENFWGTTQIANDPMPTPVFLGMKVMLTRNVNKETDYVNGMTAIVEGVYHSGVRVRTRTGFMLMIYPYTDEQHNVFYPMRVGYANTLLKMQGATIPHLTIWFDRANVEAAGYVALSRVERDEHWQFVGNPTRHHFTPASA